MSGRSRTDRENIEPMMVRALGHEREGLEDEREPIFRPKDMYLSSKWRFREWWTELGKETLSFVFF
jgi:hypothetical protein